MENGKDDLTIAITGDHTTPWSYGDHTFQAVPFALSRLSLLRGKE